MKKIITVTAISLLSINTQAFQDFVQDISKDDTYLRSSFSSHSQDSKYTGPTASTEDSSDTDGTLISVSHMLPVSDREIVGFGVGFNRASSEGESSQSTVIQIGYIQSETEHNDAFSISSSYVLADDDGNDSVSVSLAKQLAPESNSALDGELYISAGLPVNASNYSGGESIHLAAAGRLKLNDSLRFIAGGMLTSTSDYEFDNGNTFSVDPSYSFIAGAAYHVFHNVIVDVTYMLGGREGVVSGDTGEVSVDSDFSSISIALGVVL